MATREHDSQVIIKRHSLFVRVTHWINAVSFLFLSISGIAILIAFPELHWGEDGYPGKVPWFSFGIETNVDHTDWGRNLHFLFAWILVINGLTYLAAGFMKGHFGKNLVPSREQLKLPHIIADIKHHLRLKAITGKDYNFLQKLSYLIVIFLLFPLILLSGLTMSPTVTAAFPELFAMFGGRQSARTIHFICASSLLLFLLIHIWQVFLAGAANEIRSMISGNYALPKEEKNDPDTNAS